MNPTTDSPADPSADIEAPCASCLRARGLCRFHARGILPQLAQPFWYRLVGTVLIEQKKRQMQMAKSVAAKPKGSTKPRAKSVKVAAARRRLNPAEQLLDGMKGAFKTTRRQAAA